MAPTISQDIIEFYIVSKIDETGEVNGRIKKCYAKKHGLRTPNEDINQEFLKNWADVADKICFGCT